MSIVAISETLGSLGDEIGRELARALAYEFADREIVLRAAEEFGGGVTELDRLTEGRPTLWERFVETKRHYLAYVEAVIWELAARDDVVLVGRGAPFALRRLRHCLRVRVTAPEPIRARRLEARQGLVPDATEAVRQSDRERASRVRVLYQLGWDDALHYDVVVNTERLDVPDAVAALRGQLAAERFRTTPAARVEVADRALAARATATLLANAATRDLELVVSCERGQLSLAGRVGREEQRRLAEEVCGSLPGVVRLRSEIVVAGGPVAVPPGL